MGWNIFFPVVLEYFFIPMIRLDPTEQILLHFYSNRTICSSHGARERAARKELATHKNLIPPSVTGQRTVTHATPSRAHHHRICAPPCAPPLVASGSSTPSALGLCVLPLLRYANKLLGVRVPHHAHKMGSKGGGSPSLPHRHRICH